MVNGILVTPYVIPALSILRYRKQDLGDPVFLPRETPPIPLQQYLAILLKVLHCVVCLYPPICVTPPPSWLGTGCGLNAVAFNICTIFSHTSEPSDKALCEKY